MIDSHKSHSFCPPPARSPVAFHTARCSPGRYRCSGVPLPQARRDLAAVHLRHVAVLVEDREDHRAAQMFVAAVADDAEPLQLLLEPSARRRRRRHAVAERAVGVADPEDLHRFGSKQRRFCK